MAYHGTMAMVDHPLAQASRVTSREGLGVTAAMEIASLALGRAQLQGVVRRLGPGVMWVPVVTPRP